MSKDQSKSPLLGVWNARYANNTKETLYDDPSTGKIAGGFLNSPKVIDIEDWGCGRGGFRKYIGAHQNYIGIDGSKTQFASKTVSLENYTSKADAIHIRHILEHNLNCGPFLRMRFNHLQNEWC